MRFLLVIASFVLAASVALAGQGDPRLTKLERSYWLHASLGQKPHKGYWSPGLPPSEVPTEVEVSRAARLLTGPYGANRLYLVYHQEIASADARRVFTWWRRCLPAEVELVPTLVLRMYDKRQTPVFSTDDLQALSAFFKQDIRVNRVGIFDVYPNRDQGPELNVLAEAFPGRLTRVGIQPDETLQPPLSEAVEDTWSGFCHGKTNADWLDVGFGADTLRKWIAIRNQSPHPTAWDLIVVAWDYASTQRGEYPGYDDAKRNMPLPVGRNVLAMREIFRLARPEKLAGFSSDLTILQHASSMSKAHDGLPDSFYQTLKRGEVYRGYYGRTFAEVAAIYRGLRAGKRIDVPTTMPTSTQTP